MSEATLFAGFCGARPLPLTVNPPPLVLDSRQVNMFALDKQRYTMSADLPGACQTLYQNVAQASTILATLTHKN